MENGIFIEDKQPSVLSRGESIVYRLRWEYLWLSLACWAIAGWLGWQSLGVSCWPLISDL